MQDLNRLFRDGAREAFHKRDTNEPRKSE
jgi:hypothetical protein